MATDERLMQMLFRLVDLTASGKQAWEKVPEREDPDYQTQVGHWTVEIQTVDGDGQPPYRLAIVGDDQDEIEWMETARVSANMAAARRQELLDQNHALRDLYEAARREVTGANAALDEINQILNEN